MTLRSSASVAILSIGLIFGLADAWAADPELVAFRGQATQALGVLPATPERDALLEQVAAFETFREIDAALQPLTLANIAINPEARVKIASALDRTELVANEPRRFLVRVENLAGVTAPLRIRGLDLAQAEPREADWLSLRFVDPATGARTLEAVPLDGAVDGYHVVELISLHAGIREVRLTADAGQGTQDLGFRATADVQIKTKTAADAP